MLFDNHKIYMYTWHCIQCQGHDNNSSREFVLEKDFFENKKLFLFERKGFGRGGEISSFLEELGAHFHFQKKRLCFSRFFCSLEVPKGSTMRSKLDFPGNPTVKYHWFTIGYVTKSSLERQGTAFGDLQRAGKSRKTQTVFLKVKVST